MKQNTLLMLAVVLILLFVGTLVIINKDKLDPNKNPKKLLIPTATPSSQVTITPSPTSGL